MAQAVSSPSTFGFAPVITLSLPVLSLPNQCADVLGERLGVLARGLGREARVQRRYRELVGSPGRSGKVNVARSKSVSRIRGTWIILYERSPCDSALTLGNAIRLCQGSK